MAQSVQGRRGAQAARSHETARPIEPEMIERAMSAVCEEREADPLGSVPIDEMQARPSLPLAHPDTIAGTRRAERLLPVARELAIAALRELADEYGLAPTRVRDAVARIKAVKNIEPDMELRDNAAVVLSDPHTISFGTIFLAGLRSDEGMVSVLSHELIHIADGKSDTLRPLFRVIGRRAASLTALSIYGHRPEELTCDLIGAMAANALVARTPNTESLPRRLARSGEHNCVEDDDTDEDHLSPRNTMRAVFALDPELARDIMGREGFYLPLEKASPRP
jgi:predicted metallopeptidase